jgi:hypothetical protein
MTRSNVSIDGRYPKNRFSAMLLLRLSMTGSMGFITKNIGQA